MILTLLFEYIFKDIQITYKKKFTLIFALQKEIYKINTNFFHRIFNFKLINYK